MYTGRMVAIKITAFNPEAIILSGGLANAGDILIDPIRKMVR
jgi:predicted NBD/HSP70 family sugar kinase